MRLRRASSALAVAAVCVALPHGPADSYATAGDMPLLIRIRTGMARRPAPWPPIPCGQEFKLFAHYAHAAYILGDKWNCIPSCQVPETAGTVVDYKWRNSSPASVGYLAHSNGARIIVVSFRGSKDPDDWVQDSEFSLEPWPAHFAGSMVHHGFLTAYQSVAANLTGEIVRLAARHPSHKIVFTGHSLGGAEAVLCAVDILRQRPDLSARAHIYTYGMPRIGNSEWATGIEALGIPVYRVVYENDMVPHIPFQWLGYTHFAQEVWIHQNKTVFCGNRAREASQCSASVGLANYSISDHSQYTAADWVFSLPGDGAAAAAAV